MVIEKFKNQIEILEDKISKSKKVKILPHYNPDGDAIGSALALFIILKKMGKDVEVISPSQFPGFLNFLPFANKINVIGKRREIDDNMFADVDLLIGVDFNSLGRLDRLKLAFENSSAYKIVIDHHPDPEQFSDLLISDTTRSSAAELIYDLIIATNLKNEFDKDVATNLYVGIMTDTGSFSYNSSSPKTFEIVGKLLEAGVEKDKVFDEVYNSFSFDRMRFKGHVMLNRMRIFPELKTGYIYITAEDRAEFNEKYGDTENFVNIPLSIEGIIFSAIFIERENFVKISFRSKGSFDVNKFATKHFNGGGHVNASGGESYDSIHETVKNFVSILDNYSNELKNYEF